MKLFNKIAVAALSLFAMTACVDKEVDFQYFPNPDVDFTYNVDGTEYTLDFYVVSTIKFNNTSSKTGTMTWDFGDGTTSNEVSPTHKFDKAGVYQVTLTIEGVGSKTYPLMINDIVPVLTVDTQSTEIVEFGNTTLTFALELPNPEKLLVKYVWKFPEGTTDADGNPVTSFVGMSDAEGNIEYPAPVKFCNVGSQKVEISTWFDTEGENRQLADTYLNVQVGTQEPCPTLYYAVRGGNIMALKLVDNVPDGTKILPFDMGVSAGSTVFNLVYADVPSAETDEDGNSKVEGWVYILDAGKQYYYINDEDGVLGDGQVTAMRTDGTGVNCVITNVGGPAFLDPFIGFAYNGNLYYSDRNTGVSTIPLSARGEVQGSISSTQRDKYFFQNNTIPYYGRGIAYGAITNGIYRDSRGVWWIGKKYNGLGIFRLRDSDMYATQADAEKVGKPFEVVLSDIRMSTFAIDEARKALYMYHSNGSNMGFRVFPLPADNETIKEGDCIKTFPMDCDPVNTTADEGLYITQMAVDNTTGRVYFCYRMSNGDTSGFTDGVYYYDPADQKMVKYGETKDKGTGIVINPNKTKLF